MKPEPETNSTQRLNALIHHLREAQRLTHRLRDFPGIELSLTAEALEDAQQDTLMHLDLYLDNLRRRMNQGVVYQ